MTTTEPTFEERLRRVTRKHRRMSENGVARRMGPDGLVVEYPRRRMPRFPWRALVSLIVVAVVFKAAVLASLGATEYGLRVERLQSGTTVERASALVLQVDPASVMVADLLNRLGG